MKAPDGNPQTMDGDPPGRAEAGKSRDVHFVHRDGPSVRVRHYAIDDGRGVRYSAELTSVDGGVERAIIDAASHEELTMLLEIAARAFAQAIRLRSRAAPSRAIP
jgi:hypothetical protein